MCYLFPSIFFKLLSSTCSRLNQIVKDSASILWKTLDIDPQMAVDHIHSFIGMLERQGRYVKKINVSHRGLLWGCSRRVLALALHHCGDQITSLTLHNLNLGDLFPNVKSSGPFGVRKHEMMSPPCIMGCGKLIIWLILLIFHNNRWLKVLDKDWGVQ